MGVAATVEVAALNGENNAKARFISCNWSLAVIEQQLVACGHRAGLDVLGAAKNSRNFNDHVQIGVPTAGGC